MTTIAICAFLGLMALAFWYASRRPPSPPASPLCLLGPTSLSFLPRCALRDDEPNCPRYPTDAELKRERRMRKDAARQAKAG